MKIRSIVIALFGCLVCSPVYAAKTFVGVLWPMFGPLPAIGLVELVAELKMMPDVEVKTYLHQEWPALVDDIERQPKGTRTAVVGYSLGANSSVFVANKAKYVDLIIALQPSMLSWNPAVTGKVGRMIEVYNPNPWMTFGGMGSKKLEGGNIEYIANNDSHPGAQFNSDFRSLVKTEIAKLTAASDVEVAQAETPRLAYAPEPVRTPDLPRPRPPRLAGLSRAAELLKAPEPPKVAELTKAPNPAKQLKPEPVAEQPPKPLPVEVAASQPKSLAAFLDGLTKSVDSGNLSIKRQLTIEDMRDYAGRAYPAHTATANN